MTAPAATTFRLEPRQPPDAGFDDLREGALASIRTAAGATWTDHNPHDPGITLLEAALWALADLHYRTAERRFEGWSAERGDWRHVALPSGEVDHTLVARLFAEHADLVREAVAHSTSREGAATALIRAFPAEPLQPDAARAMVRLVREPMVLQAAFERDPEVQRLAYPASPDAERERAAEALHDAGLWPEEIEALIARARSRQLSGLLTERAEAIRARVDRSSTRAEALEALRDLAAPRLTLAQAALALATHPAPPVTPEFWESHTGRSTLWPPHPLQVRTIEPVTAADYRRLLLAAPGVKRGWVLAGVARGIRWNGADTAAFLHRRGALTLLVQPGDPALLPAQPGAALTTDQRTFLQGVLRATLSGHGGRSEVDVPYPDMAHRIGYQTPRRLLGDEMGAALLESQGVVVKGVLHLPPTGNPAAALTEAERLLSRFLSADREAPFETSPEAGAIPDYPAAFDGPWPVGGPPLPGWTPGEAVRVNEVVQLLDRVPGVLGVDGVAIQADSGGAWFSDSFLVPAYCVPRYVRHCFRVLVAAPARCHA